MNMATTVVPIWLDLMCVGIGAFQGALFAIVYKRFDLVGVLAIALLTGLGGGVLRDLLLGAGRPSGMQDKYIFTAIAGVAVALLVGRWYQKSDGIVIFLDSIAMSLFAIAGTYKGILFNTSFVVAVLLGVITAIGGGILRDALRPCGQFRRAVDKTPGGARAGAAGDRGLDGEGRVRPGRQTGADRTVFGRRRADHYGVYGRQNRRADVAGAGS